MLVEKNQTPCRLTEWAFQTLVPQFNAKFWDEELRQYVERRNYCTEARGRSPSK